MIKFADSASMLTLRVFDRSGFERPEPDGSWIEKYEQDAIVANREFNYWNQHKGSFNNPDQASKPPVWRISGTSCKMTASSGRSVMYTSIMTSCVL